MNGTRKFQGIKLDVLFVVSPTQGPGLLNNFHAHSGAYGSSPSYTAVLYYFY